MLYPTALQARQAATTPAFFARFEVPTTHPRLPYSPPVLFTLMRLDASQLRISQLAGWSIFWTRAWTILPPAVVYGCAITSSSPVSSASRSPTRISIGRILVSPRGFGSRFLSGRGLAIRSRRLQSGVAHIGNTAENYFMTNGARYLTYERGRPQTKR